MKSSFILFTGICLMAFVGCDKGKGGDGSDQDSNKVDSSMAHDGAAHIYSCPMHPEVQESGPGKCPYCGMELVHTDMAVQAAYTMNVSTTPAKAEAGKPLTLALKPSMDGKPGVDVPLDVHHEKKIHLIMVSKDLQWFDHQHPEYQKGGSYDLPYTFANGGAYYLFADYKPAGADQTHEKIVVDVAGKPATAKTYTKNELVSKAGGYEVKLATANGKFESGAVQHISAKFTKGGKAVDPNTLEDYLGAKAHVVVIGAADLDYLHVHPSVEDGAFDLHTTFNKPGIYRCWVQFQADGKVHTTDFVLAVTEGVPGEASGHEHGHEHGHSHSEEGHEHSH